MPPKAVAPTADLAYMDASPGHSPGRSEALGMSNPADWSPEDVRPRPSRLSLGLWAGAGLALAAAGGLLWAARGDAVFTDAVSSALAWCF
jgi:hypothetical protein